MGKSDAEFLKALLATFKVEAREHVRGISAGLIELEGAVEPERRAAVVEVVFREAHSLKGAARAVNLTVIEGLCQSLESVFAAMKRGELDPSRPVLDRLHRAVDGAERLIEEESPKQPESRALASELGRELGRLLAEAVVPAREAIAAPAQVPDRAESARAEAPAAVEPAPRPAKAEAAAPEGKAAPDETVRIPVSRLEHLLLQTEELLTAKLAVAQRAVELHDVTGELSRWKQERSRAQNAARSIKGSRERGGTSGEQERQDIFEFLEWNDAFAASLESRLHALSQAIDRDERTVSRMVDNLLQGTKQALMLPFATLTEIFPKFVRDLSREQGKDIRLRVVGAATEIDRRILQEIKDPLIHLMRNCVDHGIETPEERKRAGKPAQGTITLNISERDRSKVEVLVSDDGAGIDVARVRKSAAKLGILAADASMSDQEVLPLVFESGVSTSPFITDLSGRGLGLAIVQEKTAKLGGSVRIESAPAKGTTFRLLLPLALATSRGLLVRAAGQSFVVPTNGVERVGAAREDEVQTVENRETVLVGGQAVSLVALEAALELEPKRTEAKPPERFPLVLLGTAERRIAFRVDEILGEQEVLVRGLGPQLERVRNVSGAAVLGTGKVVPVLDVSDLMRSAIRAAAAPRREVPEEPAAAERRSILVVEDSITSRTLLKSILETAGYRVRTATDGFEGFVAVREERFDLVVSDVDMPRMNGFELTAKIRADRKLADVPVVLVTALESREDRERGIDVGANAYIVKSSFDQSNLLGVIKRLL